MSEVQVQEARRRGVEELRHMIAKNGKWIIFDQLAMFADALELLNDKDAETLLRLTGYLVGTNQETTLTNLSIFQKVAEEISKSADILQKMDMKNDTNNETPAT